MKTPRLTRADQTPPTTISATTSLVKIPCPRGRGFCVIRSGSGGSTERAMAGRPSVARFTQSICIATRGIAPAGSPSSGPKRIAPAMSSISPILEESRYIRYFLMLLKIPLPSSMAATMEAKLSSVKTMSAASVVTSVPVMPMAMPISALFSAGASLTPSPVIATTCPRLVRASTTRSLCAGETRA